MQVVLFDLDGTLIRGAEAIPGAAEAVEACRRAGVQVRFLTNNSSVTSDQVGVRLRSLGIEAHSSEVRTSGQAAAQLLVERGFRSAFVVGEPALSAVIQAEGIEVIAGAAPQRADAVVAGICRSLDYAWIDEALQHLLAGAGWVATNTDRTYPLEAGRVQPGAGATVGALEAASGLTPILAGKPNPEFIRRWMQQEGWPLDQLMVIGDRLDTDIALAKALGSPSYLVLTGVTTSLPDGQAGGADLREWVQSTFGGPRSETSTFSRG